MAIKCPVCGAPMENNICGYCGHKEETIQKEEIVQNSTAAPPQWGQNIVQPQVIINNQTISNLEVVQGNQ